MKSGPCLGSGLPHPFPSGSSLLVIEFTVILIGPVPQTELGVGESSLVARLIV